MRRILLACALIAAASFAATPGGASQQLEDADVYASVGESEIVLGNSVVERRWSPDRLETTQLVDKRTGSSISAPTPDLTLDLDGAEIHSGLLEIESATPEKLPRGGIRLTFILGRPGIRVIRAVEAYPGIAGFRSTTSLQPLVPVILSGYHLERVAVGDSAAATAHAFRAGADWRFDAGWNPFSIGDPHKGDWRLTTTSPPGTPLSTTAQWISMASPSDERAFIVLERRDYASSVVGYDGTIASASVDFSRDIVYFGPLEENAHAENSTAAPARHRAMAPLQSLELETVFLGFGKDADDEPWQHYRYLTEQRLTPYKKAITFNTNNFDSNLISTGAKDDADFVAFRDQLLPAAREMGVEVFIFDDGWQARSGDWCPDSPECPEPRYGSDPKFNPRFPDATFAAVNDLLRGDPSTSEDDIALGLWWTPMEFHPSSAAYEISPEWACHPVGDGTAALSIVQPDSGSNEAGIGVWNPVALGTHPDTLEPMRLIDYIESRLERAIVVYGASYFKFDYLAWIDCLGVEPADMYGYHDAFVQMVDRLQAAYPEVTFQIDETNDYRMFPFESVARGPSWFQNGSPISSQLLHNLWVLNPFVPGFSIGQGILGGSEKNTRGVDYLMSVALGSHFTFWTNISTLSVAERARVRLWTDFYKVNREEIAGFTYPLLDDPLNEGWTALQPWNPDAGEGFLLAYRQSASNSTQVIPLRGIEEGSYLLTALDPGVGSSQDLGLFSASALRSGIPVTIPSTFGYKIIRIERLS